MRITPQKAGKAMSSLVAAYKKRARRYGKSGAKTVRTGGLADITPRTKAAARAGKAGLTLMGIMAQRRRTSAAKAGRKLAARAYGPKVGKVKYAGFRRKVSAGAKKAFMSRMRKK